MGVIIINNTAHIYITVHTTRVSAISTIFEFDLYGWPKRIIVKYNTISCHCVINHVQRTTIITHCTCRGQINIEQFTRTIKITFLHAGTGNT